MGYRSSGKGEWRSAELVMELGLYASDAVVLSTGLEVGGTLITEDHHLLGEGVVRYAEKRGPSVVDLGRWAARE